MNPQSPPSTELIDTDFTEVTTPPPEELITSQNPYSSPLIRKWLHNQGFSLPEPIQVPDEDYDRDFPVQYPEPQAAVADSPETPSFESDLLPFNLDAVTVTPAQTKTEENLQPVSSLPIPPPPPPHHLKKPPASLAQEIVIDDTYNEPETPAKEKQTAPEEEQGFCN